MLEIVNKEEQKVETIVVPQKEKPKEQQKSNKNQQQQNKKPYQNQNRPQQSRPDSLLMFKGKQTNVHLRTGAIIKCVIEYVNQYDLVVTIGGMPAVVQKHAIDYTTFDEES